MPLTNWKTEIKLIALSAKDNQKLSRFLSKGFERSVYWNEYETKSENKNTANENRSFLESNFIGVNRSFFLVYSNQDSNSAKIWSMGKTFLTN